MTNAPAGRILDRCARFAARLRLRWPPLVRRLAPSERQRIFALTVVLGGICGLAAVAFHLSIELVSRLAIDRALAARGSSGMAWTLAVPTLGGLVAGALLQYVVPTVRGSGIPQVKAAYAGKGPPTRLRDAVAKFLVASLQIGTGSSLGREGPTVQICAGIVSRAGRLAGLAAKDRSRLIPVGAAAGIAAAFNAPIAAVTFTIEEIVGNLDQTVLSGAVVAAALAAIVERSVLGVDPVFSVPGNHGLEHVSSLLVYALLGVFAATLSVAFTDGLLAVRQRFKRAPWRWAQPAVGGLVTGGLATLAMAVFRIEGITGGGYRTLGDALAGRLPMATLAALCVMKLVATVFSYSSGGAGGIFAPALFIGGMAGGTLGALDVALFRHSTESLGSFALVGMGAVFAGTIRAPITSVLIIVEMTNGYSLILPLMIANMLAYGIARHYRPTPIYEALLEQDGVHLRHPSAADSLDGVLVGEVPLDTSSHATFSPATPHAELVAALSRSDRQEVFPVLDGETLVGMVMLPDLIALASEPHLEGLANAADLMRAPTALRQDEHLRAAFASMLAEGVRELPVVTANGRILGYVNETSIAHAYGDLRRSTDIRGSRAPP